MHGFPGVINTRLDLEHLLSNDTYKIQALAHLQTLLDEQYGYDASGKWGLVPNAGLARLGLTRAEAVAMGAKDRAIPEPARDVDAEVAAAKKAKKAEAAAACEACLSSLGARFPPSEKLTWERQLAEATAILGDAEPSVKNYPWIAGIIAKTGETLGAFAQAVVDNHAAWRAAATSAMGQRQKICLDVDAATTMAEVEAIPVSITLPEAG